MKIKLLLRFRNDDINMRSTWLCSRNDVIANAGVLLASGAVAVTGSWWPDPLVGAIIATLILLRLTALSEKAWPNFAGNEGSVRLPYE